MNRERCTIHALEYDQTPANQRKGHFKFFARTSVGTCTSQSVSENIESSQKAPLSNMRGIQRPRGACLLLGWNADGLRGSTTDLSLIEYKTSRVSPLCG